MSRPITPAILSSMMAQESEEGFVVLLAITHPGLPNAIRVCSHDTFFESNGDFYFSYPFQVPMPGDDPEATASVELRIDNVDRAITASLRAIVPGQKPPTVTMSVVTISYPDNIEAGPFFLSLVSVFITSLVVTGNLGYEPILDKLYPSGTITPLDFPGNF